MDDEEQVQAKVDAGETAGVGEEVQNVGSAKVDDKVQAQKNAEKAEREATEAAAAKAKRQFYAYERRNFEIRIRHSTSRKDRATHVAVHVPSGNELGGGNISECEQLICDHIDRETRVARTF